MNSANQANVADRPDSLAERLLARILPPLAWLLCRTLGLATWFFTNRRNTAIRNLALAFPEKDAAWHRKMAFASVLGMFEMFTIPLVLPHIGNAAVRRRFSLAPGAADRFRAATKDHPTIFATPHCAMMEALAVLPALDKDVTHVTTVYRPLDFRPADRLVLRARQHWGMKLISRRDGLLGLRKELAAGQSVGILFDQNALTAGALILSFGRVCSATDLPGILASKLHLSCNLVHPIRTGFLRARIDVIPIESDGSAADITARTSLCLEKILRENEDACADWMWAHRRWNSFHARSGAASLNLEAHRSYLAESLKAMGLAELPRRQPFCLRLPSDPALASIAAQWMPALRAARPDVRWIVVAPGLAATHFREGENCDRLVTTRRGHVESALRSIRTEYPQIYFSLEPDSDLKAESAACHAEYKAGISTQTACRKTRRVVFITPPERLAKDEFGKLLADFFAFCGLRERPAPSPDATAS